MIEWLEPLIVPAIILAVVVGAILYASGTWLLWWTWRYRLYTLPVIALSAILLLVYLYGIPRWTTEGLNNGWDSLIGSTSGLSVPAWLAEWTVWWVFIPLALALTLAIFGYRRLATTIVALWLFAIGLRLLAPLLAGWPASGLSLPWTQGFVVLAFLALAVPISLYILGYRRLAALWAALLALGVGLYLLGPILSTDMSWELPWQIPGSTDIKGAFNRAVPGLTWGLAWVVLVLFIVGCVIALWRSSVSFQEKLVGSAMLAFLFMIGMHTLSNYDTSRHAYAGSVTPSTALGSTATSSKCPGTSETFDLAPGEEKIINFHYCQLRWEIQTGRLKALASGGTVLARSVEPGDEDSVPSGLYKVVALSAVRLTRTECERTATGINLNTCD